MKQFPVIAGMILLLLLVPAVAADTFKVNGISPSTGPLGTTLPVIITGSGFDATTSVTMTKCSIKYGGSSGIVRGTITSYDSNHLYVNFQLSGNGVIVDDYDVKVIRQSFMPNELAELDQAFRVYQPSGSTPTATTTTSPDSTATATTVTTSPDGENSVFFETSPSGAEIWLDGNDVGTAAFTYYTNRDGTYDVVVKKTGYEDYAAKVTIIRGQRVHFYAPLTPLEFNSTDPTHRPTTGPVVKNVTPSVKSTLKIPTPLGTDPPTPTEESPVDPALALGAAAVATALVVAGRR